MNVRRVADQQASTANLTKWGDRSESSDFEAPVCRGISSTQKLQSAASPAQPVDRSSSQTYCTGCVAGAPWSFTKNTRNFAGCVALALRETL